MGTRGIAIACALACATACGGGAKTPDTPLAPPLVVTAPRPIEPAWRWANPHPAGHPLHAIWAAKTSAPVIAVGERGTILGSDDAATFTARRSPTDLGLRVVVGSARGDLIFAAGDKGVILRSRDRGASFDVVRAPKDDGPTLTAGWADDAARSLVFVGDGGAIVVSDDGGASFADRTSDWHNPYNGVAGDGAGTIVVAGWSHHVVRSTDGGRTFADVEVRDDLSFGAVAYRDRRFALASDRGRRISLDGGATLVKSDAGCDGPMWDDGVGLVVPAGTGIARSVDDGVWCQRIDLHAPITAVAGAAGALFASAADGAIRRSVDGGTTWQLATALMTVPLEVAFLGEDGVAWAAGGRDNVGILVRSEDAGASWTIVPGEHDPVESVWAAPDGEVFVVERGRLLRARDDWKTWTTMNVRELDHRADPSVDVVWGDGRGALWALGRHEGLYSHDAGKTWTRTTLEVGTVRQIWLDERGVLWAVGHEGVASSSDRGATWKRVLDRQRGEDFAAIGGLGSTIVVAEERGGLRRSNDGGASFAEETPAETKGRALVGVRVVGRTIQILGHDGEILVGDEDGASWKTESTGGSRHVAAFASNTRGERLVVGLDGAILVYGTTLPHAAATLGAPPRNGSPFATLRANDERKLAKLVSAIDAAIAPALRLATDAGWGEVKLGATVPVLSRTQRVGKRLCENEPCVGHYFGAELESKSSAPPAKRVTGSFVDGVLFSIDVQLGAPMFADEDERRLYVRAIERVVTSVLGAPTRTYFPNADELTLTLSCGAGRELRLEGSRSSVSATFRLTGGPGMARVAALDKAEAAAEARRQAAEEAAHRRRLCLCKHISVQPSYPQPSPMSGSFHSGSVERISAIDPKTCSVTLAKRPEHPGLPETTRQASCADFDDRYSHILDVR